MTMAVERSIGIRPPEPMKYEGVLKRIPDAVQFAFGLAAMLCLWGAWWAARLAM